MFLTFAFAVMLAGQTREHPQVTYDKFEDLTAIQAMLRPRESPNKQFIVLALSAQHGGKAPRSFSDDAVVGFTVATFGTEQRYQEHHEVKMMCGDEHIPLFAASSSYDCKKGENCIEFLHVAMSLATMKKFLDRPDPWEVRLGIEKPFPLSQSERAWMAEFVEFLTNGKG